MRLILAFLSMLGITFGIPPQQPADPTPTAVFSPSTPQTTISVDNTTYAYARIGPLEASKITLFSNLPDKKTTNDLQAIHGCSSLTSGGFYDTEDRHIGLFEVNNGTLHKGSPNALFNGYVWATGTTAGIGTTLPDQPLTFALQTGPVLIDNGELRQLKLTTDENARRITVGVTQDHTLIFMTVFAESTQFSGPRLVELPAIVDAINKKENLQLVSVINLDGGNHSAFYGSDQTLTELSPVGSIFCIK